MALAATLFVALIQTLVGTLIVDLVVTVEVIKASIIGNREPSKSQENRAAVQAALSTTSLGQVSGFLISRRS